MSTAGPQSAPPATLDDVRGWFFAVDRHLFVWFLEQQKKAETPGDLIEMGAYLGRSAIMLGDYVREGETFTVCDLFDSDAPDEANSGEMAASYRDTLTRKAFESNYLAFHDALPIVVQAPTSVMSDGRTEPKSARFVHIDASHLYEHVIGDIAFAKEALSPEGVVVLDDYRSEHTPGVSAAVWEAVATMDLLPIVVSANKFYGTWGDPTPLQDLLLKELAEHPELTAYEEKIRGNRIIRLRNKAGLKPPAFRTSRFHDHIMAERTAEAERDRRLKAAEAAALPARAKRLAKDLLPPAAARAIRNARRRSR
ncbi:class I SAM-dependent methyltransferase [Streptacidiphilus sp. MAP5-3]|uniref:class I SAM-dependent methyltransferase n=1 Tax=unclassified Streptacidiphilus TaxID=2643834 RepID=UPI003514BBE2